MDHSQSYERVLPLPKKGSHLRLRIFLFCAYGILAVLGVLAFLLTLNPYVPVLTVLLLLCLILPTRKYLSVEYEYAFLGGVLTVAKILGKSTRRTLAEADLEHLLLADYLSPASLSAAARLTDAKAVDARAHREAVPSLLLVWEQADKSRAVCIIESDERTEQILRRSRPEACSHELKRGTPPKV